MMHVHIIRCNLLQLLVVSQHHLGQYLSVPGQRKEWKFLEEPWKTIGKGSSSNVRLCSILSKA